MSTLFRIIGAVFSGEEFVSVHEKESAKQIFEKLKEIPYQLSIEQRQAVVNAMQNDVSYIQGPPGTGKSFTISALALVASSLGMKVLITSQKLPAVEIVFSKVSKVLGDDSCLFLSDDSERKKQTKQMVNNILEKSRVQEYDAEQSAVLTSVATTLERMERAKKQLSEIYEMLNEHYRFNEAYLDALERICKIYPDAKEEFSSTLIQGDQQSSSHLRTLAKECRYIREEALIDGGQVPLSKALRLKVLVLHLMKKTGASIESYRRFREDYIDEILTIVEGKGAALRVQNKINPEQLRYLRNSHTLALQKLYEWDVNGENLLAKKLQTDNNRRITTLLSLGGYAESLRAFTVRLRWKTKSRVDAANQKIDFTRLFKVFPIVMGESKALHPFLPFQSEIFDLVVIDEASQVNLAEIVPILYRAKRICIVGDHKQLGIKAGGLIFLNKFFERLMWQRHFGNLSGRILTVEEAMQRSLLVTDSSVLDLARNEANSLLSERNSNTLREHFRSLPMLAEFTSKEFYQDNPREEGLRVMTSTPGQQKLVAFRDIEVSGTRAAGGNKSNPEEIKKVVSLVGGILNHDDSPELQDLWKIEDISGTPSVGIVSFISDQIEAIEDACMKTFSVDELRRVDLMIGTPEKFQGNERDVIVFTPSIDETCSRSVSFMEEATRFNVATSRARMFTFFVHGKIPNNMERMHRLIKTMEVPKIEYEQTKRLPRGWKTDPSLIKSEIEQELYEDLQRYKEERLASRLHIFIKVNTCGLIADFVVYSENNDCALLIEIDGKNSVTLANEENDRQTERYLTFRRAGWDIFYYDYLRRYAIGRQEVFSEFSAYADRFFTLP